MKIIFQKTGLLIILFIIAVSLLSVTKPPRFNVFVTLSKAKDHLKMMAAAKPFLEKIAADNNFFIDITDDTSKINDANLSKYQVFVQLQQAPFDLSYSQQDAIRKFVEQGKGWVGIHAAGLPGKSFVGPDKKYWQWYEDFIGGISYSPHPAFQKGIVQVEDHEHPVMKNLPGRFEVPDEWYEFDKSPRPNVHVLAVADESSYKQNKPMGDHPIIWTNEKYRRMVYIAIGHDASLCTDKNYTILITNAILWAGEK
ncbi:MAG: ThuA domain-containing protein [Bacteroidetes bacterium]|nr:ThuA domain-containing protein [Bacteroidota bacterium]